MIEWAIGSISAYNALPAATQARFSARYDSEKLAWDAVIAFAGVWPDDIQVVFIESLTLSDGYSPPFGGACTNTGVRRSYTITSLDPSFNITVNQNQHHNMNASSPGQGLIDMYVTGVNFIQTASGLGKRTIAFSANGNARLFVNNCTFVTILPGDIRFNTGIFVGPIGSFLEFEIYNCIFSKCFHPIEINSGQPISSGIIENCIGYDNENGPYADVDCSNVTVKNFVMCGGASSDWTGQTGLDFISKNAVFVNCADSDGSLTTGTDTTNNIVEENEFLSTTYGDSNFLRLKNVTPTANASSSVISGNVPLTTNFTGSIVTAPLTGVLYNAGTVPTLENTDFDGNVYGADGNYPIGPFQAQGATFTPTDYSWDFNDGTTSTEQNPTKKYSKPKLYTVTFSATDGATSLSDTVDVTVFANTNINTGMATHRTNKSFTLGLTNEDIPNNEALNNGTNEQGV